MLCALFAVCSVVATHGAVALLGNERRQALALIDAFARTFHVPYVTVTSLRTSSRPPSAAADAQRSFEASRFETTQVSRYQNSGLGLVSAPSQAQDFALDFDLGPELRTVLRFITRLS